MHRAALCAARVAISAAVGSGEGDIWGVSDPLCHPQNQVPGPQFEEVAHAPDECRRRPAEPRFVHNIAECAAGVVRDTYVDFIGRNTA